MKPFEDPVTWEEVNAASEAVRYTVNPQLLQLVCDRFAETTTERLNYLLTYHRSMLPGFKDLVEETERQIESIQLALAVREHRGQP